MLQDYAINVHEDGHIQIAQHWGWFTTKVILENDEYEKGDVE